MEKPKFELGEKVSYELSAVSTEGFDVKFTKDFHVKSIKLVGTSHGVGFHYDLSESLPGAYWDGGKSILNVAEQKVLKKV